MTQTPSPPPQDAPSPRTAADKVDRSRLVGGIVIAIVAIWFVLANTRDSKITFWFVTVSSPMWLTLAGTFLAGMLASLLLTRARRNK
jgi:putative membrane protein